MLTQIERLKNYREAIYSLFHKRKDAIMNLLDAISSFGHRSRSVVELSEAACFERQYSSITDAIADGLPHADWEAIELKQLQILFDQQAGNAPCFLVDCTPNPRPFSKKLADRTITHAPNPAPGNKPICVGHQYSCVAMLPDNESASSRKWIAPISMQRVSSHQKGNECGMQQLTRHIKQFGLEDKWVVSVADSLYSSEACRKEAAKNPRLLHIFRVNSKRNVYQLPGDNSSGRGRKKVYGDKVSLSNEATLPMPDRQSETSRLSRSGKIYQIKIESWDDILIRGSKHYNARKHPITLLRIRMFDDQGNATFKRPLWLAGQGQARKSISLTSVYNYYVKRYDIEHFFRFGKNNLLLDEFQTCHVEHEENWWSLCMLAYNQLYLAKSLVPLQTKPWERHLKQNPNNPHREIAITTPSQTQRGFANLLSELGTPAANCVPRGRLSGRKKGEKGPVLSDQPIIFKAAKLIKKVNIAGSENIPDNSNPLKIQALLQSVQEKLRALNLSPRQFTQMLCDTG